MLPDEEESELIVKLAFLALGYRCPWGVPTQDREKRARAVRLTLELWFDMFYKQLQKYQTANSLGDASE